MSHLETQRDANQLSYKTIGYIYQIDMKKQNLGRSLTACRHQRLKLHVLAFNSKLYLTLCTWNIYRNTFCKKKKKNWKLDWNNESPQMDQISWLRNSINTYSQSSKTGYNQKFALFQKPCQCLYDKSNVIYFLLIMIRDQGKKKCDTSLSNLFIFYCLTKI